MDEQRYFDRMGGLKSRFIPLQRRVPIIVLDPHLLDIAKYSSSYVSHGIFTAAMAETVSPRATCDKLPFHDRNPYFALKRW